MPPEKPRPSSHLSDNDLESVSVEGEELSADEVEPQPDRSPPRRPPTRIGTGGEQPSDDDGSDGPDEEWRARDEGRRSLASRLALLLSELDMPLRDCDLAPGIIDTLERAGIRTLGQALGMSDVGLKSVGVDASTRDRLARWRRRSGLRRR